MSPNFVPWAILGPKIKANYISCCAWAPHLTTAWPKACSLQHEWASTNGHEPGRNIKLNSTLSYVN